MADEGDVIPSLGLQGWTMTATNVIATAPTEAIGGGREQAANGKNGFGNGAGGVSCPKAEAASVLKGLIGTHGDEE